MQTLPFRRFKFLKKSILAVLLCLSSCKEEVSKVPEPVGEFEQNVQPIFNRHCVECHSSRNAVRRLSLESWESLLMGSENGAMVIPFHPKFSHLFQHLHTDTTLSPVAPPLMPIGRNPLSREDVMAIYNWIQNGARNRNGKVPFEESYAKIYVTNQAADLVAVIDKRTGLLMRYVDVSAPGGISQNPLQSPHYVTVSNNKKYWYVSLIAKGEVWKFDAETDTLVAKVSVGSSPAHIVCSPDDSTLYVSNFSASANRITIIDATTMTVKRTSPPINTAPHGLALSRNGRWLYATAYESDRIVELDLETFSTRQFPLRRIGEPSTRNYRPYQVMLSPDEKKLFVTCNGDAAFDGDLRIIDLETLDVKSVPVGKYPILMDYTPDKSRLYIANRNSNSVSVVNVQSETVAATIENVGVQPHGLAVSSDGFVYVSNESLIGFVGHHPTDGGLRAGTSSIIDSRTNQVVKVVEMLSFPAGVAIRE
ncbi:MAG: YncE family protein [Chloroherpetonaceae bacterium]